MDGRHGFFLVSLLLALRFLFGFEVPVRILDFMFNRWPELIGSRHQVDSSHLIEANPSL